MKKTIIAPTGPMQDARNIEKSEKDEADYKEKLGSIVKKQFKEDARMAGMKPNSLMTEWDT